MERLRSRWWSLLGIGLSLLALGAAVEVGLSAGQPAGRGRAVVSPASSSTQHRLLAAAERQMRLSPAAARSYRPSRVPGGLALRNARQGLDARMWSGGAEVRSGSLQLGLHLSGYGSAETLHLVPAVVPQSVGGQVVYRHRGLTEWWANGPRALEQGFTIGAPPPGRDAGRLTLQLALSGSAHPKLLPGGRAVIFSRGDRALIYDHLRASDARGTSLPGQIALGRGRLLLEISTRSARYPLRVDPTIQNASTPDAYAQAVLADQPDVYLRLDEASGGIAADSSGNHNDGTYANGVQYGLSGPLTSDGSTSAVRMPAGGWWISQSATTFPSGNGARTVEFWVRTGDANGLPTVQYGGSSGGTNDQFRIQLAQVNGGAYMWLAKDDSQAYGSPQYAVGLPRAWWDGNWHMYDVTFDGTQALAYMDGQVAGSFPIATPLATTTPSTATPGGGMLIGQLATNSAVDVGQVAVYPGALSPQRISGHWSAGASPSGAACAPSANDAYGQSVVSDAPALYLRLGDLVGSSSDRVAYDSSGQCTTAAPTNGAFASGSAAQASGALTGDGAGALRMPAGGWWVTQSGATLPSGNADRTVEFWVRTGDANGLPTFQYGGSGSGTGDQFRVQLVQNNGGSYLSLTTDSTHSSTVGLPRAWWDGNWHMYDVSYDGTQALAYMDGQVVGSFSVPKSLGTTTPGDGLLIGQLATNSAVDVQEAAVYPTALSPQRIDAHWTAGGSSAGACAAATNAPYVQAVDTDTPSLYLRLSDLVDNPGSRVAYDSSGHCTAAAPINGAFGSGATAQPNGALSGDTSGALTMPAGGWWVTQSGATLPAANTPRTVEFWARTGDANGLPTVQYGGSGSGTGDQFRVQLLQTGGGSYLSLTTDSGHTSNLGLPRAWWDGNWHMYDVTFDGSHALGYVDGQAVGTFTVSAPLNTAVPGDGLLVGQLATNSAVDVEELAVYPAALSSQRILAHWEAQYLTPPGTSLISGSAVQGGGGGVAGARIQACPTSGASCVVDPHATDSSGAFHMIVPNDTYTVTIFPPAGSTSPAQTFGPLTLPPSVQNLKATFTPPGGLPNGVSFASPSTGTQQNTVPRVNWGEPSTVTVSGCKGGSGVVYIEATNTSTGQEETRGAQLVETPAGSGNYVAQIPPLAPDHGTAGIDPQIVCLEQASMLPNGGPSDGGTSVLIAGSGFTGATDVHFGSTAAKSFQVLSDSLILATAPAGSGTPLVTVTSNTGSTLDIGAYDYFDVTGLDTHSGPSTGGTTVTINGDGFNDVKGVLFGLMPAQSFTVKSSGQIQAVAPIGLGTVNVQVINGSAVSRTSSATQFVYQGGPAGSSNIVEPTGGGDSDLYSLANQVSNFCAQNDCVSGGYASLGQASTEVNAPVSQPNSDSKPDGMSLNDWLGVLGGGIGAPVAVVCAVTGGTACAVIGVALAGVGLASAVYTLAQHLCTPGGLFGLCNLFIDPSGTVVDTGGNPVSGATATLLVQGSGGGSFSAVDPSSGAIEPDVNPQTTGATGAFDWDALAGTYKVEASKSGCNAPGNASQPNVFTPSFEIPPPAVGMVLTLDCPGANGSPPTPAVTGVTPGSGPSGGGNAVDIAGTGLADATGVKFGDKPATNFEVLSPYAIAAVAPAGSGTVDVTVTTAGGTSAIAAADKYTYVSPPSGASSPTISGVSPATGPMTGGSLVTITGSNLDGAYAVSFGGAAAGQVTPVSATEVKAVAPAAQFPGRVDISVTTSAGSSAPNGNDVYTYGAPPPPPVPTVTVSAGPIPSLFHQAVTVTATVAPTDGGGLVAFYDGGSATPISGCSALGLTSSGGTYKATCSTSTLAPGDHTITAAYSGDSSYASAAGSGPASVTGSPVNSSPPGISGATTQGQTLSETHGTWSFNPSSYGYQWETCDPSGNGCSPIPGATNATYTLTGSDIGHTLRVQETATNVVGTSSPATSAATGVVRSAGGPPTKPANNSRPVIAGTLAAGQALTTSAGSWSGTPPLTYAYQWQRCNPGCSDIPGATGSSYSPTNADIGDTLRVTVTATNGLGSGSAASSQVGPVQPSPGQIRAVVSQLLAPSGKQAKIGALLKAGGYTFTFAAPDAGSLSISWYYLPKGAHLARHTAAKPVLVGRGTANAGRPGAAKLRLGLTQAGRALLRRARALKLTSQATYTPSGGHAFTLTRALMLRR